MTNFYWVIGTPRSGTTMLTEFIGQYTEKNFNEPFDTYPILEAANWKFPLCSSIVFKYCYNWKNANIIYSRFPNSKFIHILRNPRDVIYSMMYPKKDSFPYRDFNNLGKVKSKRFKETIN